MYTAEENGTVNRDDWCNKHCGKFSASKILLVLVHTYPINRFYTVANEKLVRDVTSGTMGLMQHALKTALK